MLYSTVKTLQNRSNFWHFVKSEHSFSRSNQTTTRLIKDHKNQVTLPPPTSYVFHTPIILLSQILSVTAEFAVDLGSSWRLREAAAFCL